METKDILVILQILCVMFYCCAIIFYLPKIVNFSTRSNFKPWTNLLLINLSLTLLGLPTYFLDKQQSFHYIIFIISALFLVSNYVTNMIDKKYIANLIKEKSPFLKYHHDIDKMCFNIFGTKDISQKEFFLISILLFPFITMANGNRDFIFYMYFGHLGMLFILAFLGKVASDIKNAN